MTSRPEGAASLTQLATITTLNVGSPTIGSPTIGSPIQLGQQLVGSKTTWFKKRWLNTYSFSVGLTLTMFSFFHRRLSSWLTGAILASATLMLTVACSQTPTQSAPISVGTQPWIGSAGHYAAMGKDLFKAQKLNIQDVGFPNVSDEMAAFLAKKIDMGWFPSADAIPMAAQDPSIRVIYTADFSDGGDGIMGRGITSPADAKGKTLAREDVLFAKILLGSYLQKANLSEKDVTVKNMTASDGATAFAAKQVDVAVSYEPYLTKASKEGKGEVIFTTKDTNLIADVLLVREDLIKTRRADLVSYLKGIDQAVKAVVADEPEALKAVGAKLGVNEEEVKAQRSGVKLFDVAENKDIAFNPTHPRNLMGNLELSAKAAQEFKMLEKPVDLKVLVDDSLVKSL
jgi:NitT/TauT family transport system substrate-binding protein